MSASHDRQRVKTALEFAIRAQAVALALPVEVSVYVDLGDTAAPESFHVGYEADGAPMPCNAKPWPGSS